MDASKKVDLHHGLDDVVDDVGDTLITPQRWAEESEAVEHKDRDR